MMIADCSSQVPTLHYQTPPAKGGASYTLYAKAGHSHCWQLLDKDNTPVVTITQPPTSPLAVTCFVGKGGLTVVVSSRQSGLRYFCLPGSRVSLGDTTIVYPLDGHASQRPSAASVATPEPVSRQAVSRQAMILGAGLATRFEPISGDTTGYAKPSVPLIGGKSVIRCLAEHLVRHGFDRLFINTYYMPQSLKASLATFARDTSADIVYLDEPAPSGTAGALQKMLAHPEQAPGFDATAPILVAQGDAVTNVDLSHLMQCHATRQAAVSIGCQFVSDNDVNKFGIVETDRSGSDGVSGKVQSFLEKPSLEEAGPHRLANTGFYVFAPEVYPVFDTVFQRQQAAGNPLLDFANDIFPAVLAQNTGFWAEQLSGFWYDIGNPVQYAQTLAALHAGMDAGQAGAYRQGVYYWPGTFEASQAEGLMAEGAVIVAKPFQEEP